MVAILEFRLIELRNYIMATDARVVYLVKDNWNDMFKYVTQFWMHYVDDEHTIREIGLVKIGRFGMEGEVRPGVPDAFTTLGEEFFSLGQDKSYYQALHELGDDGDDILRALHDIAADADLFERAAQEDVTQVSLMRSVAVTTVEHQFRRILLGYAPLTQYAFEHSYAPHDGGDGITLRFAVRPDSYPPTNVHVIIGRNGTGKTTTLRRMASGDLTGVHRFDFGRFATGDEIDELFAGVAYVSFSAFDDYDPSVRPAGLPEELDFTYIGLRGAADDGVVTKVLADLVGEFAATLKHVLRGPAARRWTDAIQTLDSDPLFAEAGVSELRNSPEVNEGGEDEFPEAAAVFTDLSAGHKIVLLTLTRLVQTVQERTLVLIDEPEAHLHPPLLRHLHAPSQICLFSKTALLSSQRIRR